MRPRPAQRSKTPRLASSRGGRRQRGQKPGKTLTVVNKIDLASAPVPASPATTRSRSPPRRARGWMRLKTALVQDCGRDLRRSRYAAHHARPAPPGNRARARSALKEFLRSAEAGEQTELAAEHLREAADALGRLTGRLDVEDVLGQIRVPRSVCRLENETRGGACFT